MHKLLEANILCMHKRLLTYFIRTEPFG